MPICLHACKYFFYLFCAVAIYLCYNALEWTPRHTVKNSETLRKWAKSQLQLRGMTPADLSRETGVRDSTWSRVFHGKTKNLTPETVAGMCKAFRATEEMIFQLSIGNAYHIAPHSGRAAEGREPNSRWKWMKLAEWLEVQPTKVQDTVLTVAASHGYQP
jgi:transcriptional regulator with XRE-family HTH domain